MNQSKANRRKGNRPGFTLYEVVLALAILLGSMAVISQLIATGSRAGIKAQMQSAAVLHCQTKLAEVVAGAEPLTPRGGEPLGATLPGWEWELVLAPGPLQDLVELQVTTSHRSESGQLNATVTLTRYLRDPSLFQDVESTSTVAETFNGSSE